MERIERKTKIMVDSTFLEWDKVVMFMHLQQRGKHSETGGRRSSWLLSVDSLKANIALIVVLVLIIPTTSGVALIA